MCVCRSRSMTEVDVLAASDVGEDTLVFHEQLVEPIQLTLFTPHLTTTVIPSSPTIIAPSVTSSLPRPCDTATRHAQRRSNGRGTFLNIASTSSSSLSSVYESGTMSASVSRDHSPQRYPRPPPNMIINPAHCRSLSADRTYLSQYSSALQRLVKRLSDVIDKDDDVISSGGTSSAAGRCQVNNTEHHHGNQHKQQQQVPGSDVRTRDFTLESGHVSRKATSHTEIASSSSSSSPPPAAVAVSSSTTLSSTPTTLSVSSAGRTTNSRLSRWTATLALFRKKTRRSENKQSSSSSSASAPPTPSTPSAAAASVARPLQEQCASLSSGDVMASVETCSSRQVHSDLSQSQPLHNSTAASLALPATAPSSSYSSSRGSKLARIIDPLKLRRRPNSSSVDLQTTFTSSSGGEVVSPSRRPHALLTARPTGTRRSRHSLTSAYMQGSL